jgi:hypothetical protein
MSEQIEVEILTQTITAQHGVLSAGDVIRTDAAFAAHLVNDCAAAKYTKAKAAAPAPAPVETEQPQQAAPAKPAKKPAK